MEISSSFSNARSFVDETRQIDWSDFLSESCNCETCTTNFNILVSKNRLNSNRTDKVNLAVVGDFALDSNKIMDVFGILTTKTRLDNELKIKQKTIDELILDVQTAFTVLGGSVTSDLLDDYFTESSSAENINKLSSTSSINDIEEGNETKRRKLNTSTSVTDASPEGAMAVEEYTSQSTNTAAAGDGSSTKQNKQKLRIVCKKENCTRYNQGKSEFCIAHGGGYRCTHTNCNKGT
jgi:hypothetical protein